MAQAKKHTKTGSVTLLGALQADHDTFFKRTVSAGHMPSPRNAMRPAPLRPNPGWPGHRQVVGPRLTGGDAGLAFKPRRQSR